MLSSSQLGGLQEDSRVYSELEERSSFSSPLCSCREGGYSSSALWKLEEPPVWYLVSRHWELQEQFSKDKTALEILRSWFWMVEWNSNSELFRGR